MKEYIKPELEVIRFEVEEIATAEGEIGGETMSNNYSFGDMD